MTYLPDLRDSLVKAAQRQQESAIQPSRRARRRVSFGGVATFLAAVAGVAVAVLALTIVRHGHSSDTRPSSQATPAQKHSAARAAAVDTLGLLVLPPGAVRSGLVRGTPAELWSPSDKLGTAHRIDVYRVWRVPGSPQQVVNFIQSHPPAGSEQGAASESGSSSSKGGHEVVDAAAVTFGFRVKPGSTIVRELAVQAVRLPGGGSAVRADGEAGWIAPRAATERIPVGTDRVLIVTGTSAGGQRRHGSGGGRGVKPRPEQITSPTRINALVKLLNQLPLAQPGVYRCLNGSGPLIRFAFYAGTGSVADAAVLPSCDRIRLTIGGRAQPDLAIGVPAGNLPQDASQLKALLSFTAGH